MVSSKYYAERQAKVHYCFLQSRAFRTTYQDNMRLVVIAFTTHSQRCFKMTSEVGAGGSERIREMTQCCELDPHISGPDRYEDRSEHTSSTHIVAFTLRGHVAADPACDDRDGAHRSLLSRTDPLRLH